MRNLNTRLAASLVRRLGVVSVALVAVAAACLASLDAQTGDPRPADCHVGCSFAGFTTFAAQMKEGKKPPTRVLDDPQVQHGKVMFKSGDKEIDGYLARPKKEGTYRAVIVLAGNRITEEHIQNTCAALAVAGYVGFTPNNYHAVPDSAKTVAQMNKVLEKWTDADYLRDIEAGADYLRSLPFVERGRMAVLGFCVGGRRAMLFAPMAKDVAAIVAYHPGPMKPAEIERIKVPVQIHHGTTDRAVSIKRSRELASSLREQKTPVELHEYEKADHGFLAYIHPVYNPEAAKLSWERTVAFLNEQLKK